MFFVHFRKKNCILTRNLYVKKLFYRYQQQNDSAKSFFLKKVISSKKFSVLILFGMEIFFSISIFVWSWYERIFAYK